MNLVNFLALDRKTSFVREREKREFARAVKAPYDVEGYLRLNVLRKRSVFSRLCTKISHADQFISS